MENTIPFASNCKGFGSSLYIDVHHVSSVPSQPGSISGSSPVCKSNYNKTYSVSSKSNTIYTWSITGGGIISSGQGTSAVKVDFRQCTTNSVVLSVTASNSCGTSVVRTKTIVVNLNCRIADDEIETTTEDVLESINVYPNPASENMTIRLSGYLPSPEVKITLTDVLGRIVLNENKKVETNSIHIHLDSKIPTGVYLLKIETTTSFFHKTVEILR